jgi:hypothetical protein
MPGVSIGKPPAHVAQWSDAIDVFSLPRNSAMRANWQRVLLIGLAAAMHNIAHAQVGQIGSYNRPKTNNYPAFSPYLNLNRGGDPAVNYFGIVRPQMETNRAFQQIEQGTFGADPRFPVGAGGADGNPIPGMNNYYPNQAAGLNTGHPATFFYYSHYYQFPSAQRGGAGGGAGAGGAAGVNNANFGRPNTQATPFYFGNGGLLLPINPAGANPLGGPFGPVQQQGAGQIFNP